MPYEKVGKNEPVCIADEVPFEIPESWEWAKLGEIFQHNTGKALNSSNRSGKLLTYITTSNLYWNRFEVDSLREMYFSESEIEKYTAIKGDLLVCEGGDIGRAAIWPYNTEIRIQNHIHRLRAYTEVCTEYYYYIFFLYKHAGWIGGKGIGIKGLSANALHSLIFPLPPLHEQQRIVTKLKMLEPFFEKYTQVEKRLNNLNVQFPDLLKKSILQEAVQGKLVPQSSNDEPASILLERIREEKEKLIQEGKIKRDKHESVIFRRDNSHYEKLDGIERCIDDEIPFEIPASWEWCRLGSLTELITKGSSPKWQGVSYTDKQNGILFITSENVGVEKLLLSKEKYVGREFNVMHPSSILRKGDLLTNIVGASIGRTAKYTSNILDANINQAVCIIRLVDLDLSEYLLKYLNSVVSIDMMTNKSVESARANLSLTSVSNLLVPIPPLTEQERIISKLKFELPLYKTS